MIMEAIKSKICRVKTAKEPRKGDVPIPWLPSRKNSLLRGRVDILFYSGLQLNAQGPCALWGRKQQPPQYSCLENPMDKEAWWAIVTESDTTKQTHMHKHACALQRVCVCVCVCTLNRFSSIWLCNPMDCSLPDSSVHGILHARLLDWVAMLSFRGSSWPRGRTHISYVSCIGRQVLYH